MKAKTLLIALVSLALVACATPGDYAAYANGQAAIEAAKHAADSARYKAMSDIAATGDSTAKVAAVMALAMGQNNSANSVVRIQAPKTDSEIALQWASILVPGVVNVAGIAYGARVATNASNNAANVSMSTNSAFLGMAGKIQAPAAPQANIYTTTTTNTDRNDVTSYTDRNDVTKITTLSGTGTLGSGAYTTKSNALSGTGTLGSGAYTTSATDDHSTVSTPAPVVVTPVVVQDAAPVVVVPPVVVTNPPVQ